MTRLAARVLLQPDVEAAAAASQPSGAVTETEIRAQLRKILASSDFDASPRLHQFLAHAVEQTVIGRLDQLKGYSIAIDVFGRNADFDQMNDPVVRIEAAKLRLALERYYLMSGSHDAIGIELPKGGYVAQFARRAESPRDPEPTVRAARPPDVLPARFKTPLFLACTFCLLVICAGIALLVAVMPPRAPPAAGSWRPLVSLTLTPFVTHSAEASEFAIGLSEELLDRITRVQGVVLLAQAASDATAWKQRLILEGSVAGPQEGRLVIRWRLIDANSTAIIWAASQFANARESSSIQAQARLADNILREIEMPLSQSVRSQVHPD